MGENRVDQAKQIAMQTAGLIQIQQFAKLEGNFELTVDNVILFAVTILEKTQRELGDKKLLLKENEVLDIMLLTQRLLNEGEDIKSQKFESKFKTELRKLLSNRT